MNIKKIIEGRLIGLADIFLVYTMLSPVILLIIGANKRLEPNFIRTVIVLLGPGLLAGLIYLKAFGIQVLKRSTWIILCVLLFTLVIFLAGSKHIANELTRVS